MRMNDALVVAAFLLSGCDRSDAGETEAPTTAPSQATLSPWESIDPTFEGCSGG
jgi:hypothetical protein